MKCKKIVILFFIIFLLISINSKSSAKYVFEYIKKVAEISINK